MARSEDAILRRAVKRERTEGEQRQVDRKDMEQSKRRREKPSSEANDHPAASGERDKEVLKEVGAWTCPGCKNHNFASRHWCNSKMCDERRPDHIAPPPSFRGGLNHSNYRQNSSRSSQHPMDEEGAWKCPACEIQNFASRDFCYSRSCQKSRPQSASSASSNIPPSLKKSRHDPETSKQLTWAKQADRGTLSKNQELRKRFQENQGVGMLPEDIERAKTLLARDERKRQKKIEANCMLEEANSGLEAQGADSDVKSATSTQEGNHETPKDTPEVSDDKPNQSSASSKSKSDRNKALRKRYLETKGEGMKPEDMERAKLLLARDERKRGKRAMYNSTAEEAHSKPKPENVATP